MPIAIKVEITVGCVMLALCGCDDAPRHAAAQTPRAPVHAVAPTSAPQRASASPDTGTTATATSAGATPSVPVAEPGRAGSARLVLWIGGDVIVPPGMIRAVRGNAGGDLAAGLESVFAPLTRFWQADAPDAHVMVNMESPVADRTRLLPDAFVHLVVPGRLVPSPLNMPRAVPEGLRRAGVHSVTLANNHALDQGRDGLAETLANVRAAGLGIVGAGQGSSEAVRPMVLGPAGARTAVISLLDRHQREPRSAAAIGIARDPEALASIRRAAAEHDAVIVVLHVVAELRERPLRAWRRLVSKILDAGADVVISHGTHVVGPVIAERRAGRPVLVAWGLGNLLTEMGNAASPRAPDPRDDKWASARSREQLLARIEVRPRSGAPADAGAFGTRARIEVSFLPAWMSHDRDLVERHVIRGPIRHSIEPVAACGRPIPLPETWPERERVSVDRWVARRRDHMLRASRLRSARCDACGTDEACRRASGPHLLAAPHLAE